MLLGPGSRRLVPAILPPVVSTLPRFIYTPVFPAHTACSFVPQGHPCQKYSFSLILDFLRTEGNLSGGAFELDMTTTKGITKEIKFDAAVNAADGKATGEAALKVDRTDFNVNFRSDNFFENPGDKTIYEEFDLKVKLVASK